MKNKFSYKDIFNIKNLILFIISLVIGIIIFLLVYALHDYVYMYAMDGLFAGGAALVGIGLLALASNQGTFDIIVVGFANLFAISKKQGKKKYDGLYDYQTIKAQDRTDARFQWLVYVTAGVIYLIIAGIMLAEFYN